MPTPSPLVGTWEVADLEVAGVPVAVPVRPWVWVVWPDSLRVELPGGTQVYRWVADPTTTPPRLELSPPAPPDAPAALHGVCQLAAGVLSVCYGPAADPPPLSFATSRRDGYTLVRLRRKK